MRTMPDEQSHMPELKFAAALLVLLLVILVALSASSCVPYEVQTPYGTIHGELDGKVNINEDTVKPNWMRIGEAISPEIYADDDYALRVQSTKFSDPAPALPAEQR